MASGGVVLGPGDPDLYRVQPGERIIAAAEVDEWGRRQAAWRTPLGQRAQEQRRTLLDLADTRADVVILSPERARAIAELLADLVEGGPRA